MTVVRDHCYSKDAMLDWCTAIRWASCDQDPRRLSWLADVLLSNPLSSDKTSQAQLQQIKFLESLLQEFSWRGISLAEKLLDYCSKYLDHPYKQVREGIASLLCLIFSLMYQPGRDYHGIPTLKANPTVLSQQENFVEKIVRKMEETQGQKGETIENFRELVLQWFSFSMDEMHSISPFFKKLLPSAFILQKDTEENTRNLSKVVIALASQIYLPKEHLQNFVETALHPISKNGNWRVKSPLSTFLQIFVFNHSFILPQETISEIFSLVINLLGDKQIEVGEAAKNAISSFIRITGTDTIHELIREFSEMSKCKLPPKKDLKTKEGEEALSKRQKGLLGLSALVLSQPYDVPEWYPPVVTRVSKHLRDPLPIKKTASDCLKDFWRTHQDEWIFFQDKFTQDQINSITESTAPSYFA